MNIHSIQYTKIYVQFNVPKYLFNSIHFKISIQYVTNNSIISALQLVTGLSQLMKWKRGIRRINIIKNKMAGTNETQSITLSEIENAVEREIRRGISAVTSASNESTKI